METNITIQTKQMIDNLKAICTNYGLGNASSEYKIITEVFLYKFLNDKFIHEARNADKSLSNLSPDEVEKKLSQMSEEDYELFLLGIDSSTAKLKREHFISYLFNRKNEEDFARLIRRLLICCLTFWLEQGFHEILCFAHLFRAMILEKRYLQKSRGHYILVL